MNAPASGDSGASEPFVIYPARRVITMNPAFPDGDAVAVSGERILGVGSAADLASWGSHRVDDRFCEHVLLPGFIEAHCHVMSGGLWSFTYVGFFDRRDPQGRLWPGCKSIDDVLARLRQALAELRGDGLPNGELHEPAGMMLAGDAFVEMMAANRTEAARWRYAEEARNAGHTLLTDLGTTQLWDTTQLDNWKKVTSDPEYPARVMVALSNFFGAPAGPDELAELGARLVGEQTSKLRFGIVKLILDGSIQGFTARISWPHYYKAPPGHIGNGLWLTTPAQYRRMAALGMCANIFANHIFNWGDQHRDATVGPERAARMDAYGTALAEGASFSIHSDSPITPLGHLHTAWCAVNRVTASGEVLGSHERIGIPEALRAITIDAARQLKLDAEVGSIEAGKLADFAVLEDDPLSVDPMTLRDIGVWGTVLGGVPQPAKISEN